MADKSDGKVKGKHHAGPGRPFKKGSCPNPGGRPKLSEEFKIALRGYGEEAILFQYNIMIGKLKANMRERVKCSELLADRGLGRPVQGVDLQSDGPVFVLLNHETEGI